MSLNSLMRSEHSWMMQFMHHHFSQVDSLAATLAKPPVETVISPSAKDLTYPWQLVATAQGYRLRYCFDVVPAERLQVQSGVNLDTIVYALSRDPEGIDQASDFFQEYERIAFVWSQVFAPYVASILDECSPHQGPLAPEQERRIDQVTYILAYWEEIRRQGVIPDPIRRASHALDPLGTLLSSVPDSVLDDLQALANRLWSVRLWWPPTESYVIHPELDVYGRLGGARADLIWNDTLWDFDASLDPARDLRPGLYRILAKLLLAEDYRPAVSEVAIYWSRFGWAHRWGVNELLAHSACPDHHYSLPEWRALFLDSAHDQGGHREIP